MDQRQSELVTWLVSIEARAEPLDKFVEHFMERLKQHKLAVWRVSCSVVTKHPEVFVTNCLWSEGEGARLRIFDYQNLTKPFFLNSPAAPIYIRECKEVRCRLAIENEAERYPLTMELRQEGGTDYFAIGLPFSTGQISFLSIATRAETGFSEDNLNLIRSLLDPLTTVIELKSAYHAQASLLGTYLGKNAAKRVLAGAFQRGGGEKIEAVIWSCDLRGFTIRSDQNPVNDVLRDLDEYFAVVTDPIHAHGGEVLKFIGDAVLAVFPFEVLGRSTCRAAFTAATSVIEAGKELNEARLAKGLDKIDFGIALHLGEVMYGNIGSQERLDFTVIGAAVNETCRLESLCKEYDTQLLVSASVAHELGDGELTSLGTQTLHGVGHSIEIFGLK